MRLVLKAVAAFALIAVIGILGVAIFAELPAPVREVSLPVEAR